MQFRKSRVEDVSCIMSIINQAQYYLKSQNIDQWQNNYPDAETIHSDIKDEVSYVLVARDNIISTVVVSFEAEKTYEAIYNGRWLSDDKYAVLHRMAVEERYKGLGLAGEIINNIEEICLEKGVFSIRIDTHEENLSMQKFLKKNKFQYCGLIYLEDNSKRLAFEKII